MLFGLDINHLLTFPVKDAQERRRFSIGALLILASTIIPILPYLPVLGYSMKIMRQVAAGQQPSMPDWDDWETLFKDGLKLLGVRLLYALPLLLLILPVFALFIVGPIMGVAAENEDIILLSSFAPMIILLCLSPLFILIGMLIPAAEAHVTIQNEFSASLRLREWLGIFRANIGGFLLAYLFIYAISALLSFVFQIIVVTIILLCLLPIITPLISMYITLIHYTLIAAAYREGTLKQSAPAATEME
jgi:hypothetical protein